MIRFHKPLLEELRFRQQLLSDEQTMAYNARWGGAVGFPQDRWAGWYSRWVEHPDRRFYSSGKRPTTSTRSWTAASWM